MTKLNSTLPCYTFPSLSFWRQVPISPEALVEIHAPFRKSSYQNRYYISTAQGLHLLSIPLIKGRHQSADLSEVHIDNKQAWQKIHWRSLMAAYRGTPYYEHYAPSLQHLFLATYERLIDFNMSALDWCAAQLKRQTKFVTTDKFFDHMAQIPRNHSEEKENDVKYHQLFEERVGFLKHLSILDLIMNEGPAANRYASLSAI